MLLDISPYGLGVALKKAAKVIGWHVASNALVIIGTYVNDVTLTAEQGEKYLLLTGSVAIANALLAGAGKWLTAIKPAEIVEIDGNVG